MVKKTKKKTKEMMKEKKKEKTRGEKEANKSAGDSSHKNMCVKRGKASKTERKNKSDCLF